MKVFALLLFSLQFLAPAILVSSNDAQGSQDKVQLINGGHSQNILYSIFSEDITESEEGREGQKDIVLFSDFDFTSTFVGLLVTESEPCKYNSLSSQQFDTQPALFKLNCTFLI